MTDLFSSQIDFIYFVYGLGFILLFPICLYLHRRPRSSLPWMWLLLFGITHGLLEWLDLVALSLGTDPIFAVFRIGLLILSFLLLAEFGRAGLVMLRGRGPGRWVLAVLLGLALLGAFAGLPGTRASARYALGLVGALGAAAALWLAASRAAPGRRALQCAALCLAGYAAAAGLVVDPAPFFPASWLNTEVFLAGVGVPIQLGRGLLAAGLSVCLSLLAVASLGQEKHRRLQKWGRNLMVGTVVSVLFLVITGWFVTQYFGRVAAREVRSGQEHHGQVLQFVLMDKMAEADRLVTTLAGSPGIVSYLASRTTQNRDQAHAILDRYSASLPGAIMYVLNREGLTIASSNRSAPDSFLGQSYAFRPYFRQALQGAMGSYYALGVTSGELGYYTSFPVRDGRFEIIGVAVIKRIISDLESFFPQEAPAVIIDAHGVVVMANRPALVLKSLWPLSAAVREQLSASRQFGPGPFTPILGQAPVDRGDCQFQGRRYLVLRQPLPFQNWSTVILTSPHPIAMARLQGLSITILSCLVVLSLLTIIGLTIESTSRVQRSENRFRQLYGNLRDGSAVVDMSGNIVESNPAFQAMLDYPPEELVKLSLQDLTPKTRQEQEARIIAEQVLPRGYSDLYEQEYRRRDGSLLPVELQTYLVQEEGDQHTGMWVFVRDITARKRADAELKESLSLYMATLESTADGLLVVNHQGRIVSANQKFKELWRIPEDIVASRDDDRALAYVLDQLEDPQGFLQKVEALYAQPAAESFDVLHFKDGRVFERYSIPQYLDREIVGRVWSFRDVTARKLSEEALRENEEKYRGLIETTNTGYVIIDTEGKVLDANPEYVRLTGYNELKEIIGRSVIEWTAEHDRGKNAVAIKDCLQAGFVKHLELDYAGSDGWFIPVEINATAISTSEGVKFLSLVRDISDRKRVEDEKVKLEAQLVQAQKMEAIGTLAGGIAHDFNNILTAIIGNISLAMLDLQMREQSRERLNQAEKACLQAQNLSRQLLTFSRGGAPIKEVISVKRLITESASFACRGSQVNYEFSLPDDLWAVEADPGQIGQVFQNLIINAIQAMPTGGMIEIRGENLEEAAGSDLPIDVGRYVKISIQDKGIGISAEHLSRIFDPYFTTKQKGSGLGLATSYSIIKNHHGHISVESELGIGTTFNVYLPASDRKVIQQPDEDGGLISGKGKILVMDDEMMVREVLGKMLLTLGYEVKLAKDGAEAIEFFSQSEKAGDPFAAVILDLTVPGGMGGKEAMARILKIDPQAKAIVSSGYSDDPIMADFQEFGFTAVIAKPYKISKLGKVLNKAITGKE